MKIKNKKNTANYVNYKDNGLPMKVMIAGGQTVDIPGLNNVSQIFNSGDFKRGFFEVVNETTVIADVEVAPKKKSSTKKSKTEDSLDKVEKEVKNYTDNEE